MYLFYFKRKAKELYHLVYYSTLEGFDWNTVLSGQLGHTQMSAHMCFPQGQTVVAHGCATATFPQKTPVCVRSGKLPWVG